MKSPKYFLPGLILTSSVCAGLLFAQAPPGPRNGDNPGGPPPFGGGPGGFGGVREKTKLTKQFDKDGDKRLNAAERKAALEFLAKEQAEGRGGRRGFGPRRMESQEPNKPGPKVSPADVKSYAGAPLYDPTTLRTFFLEFEDADWEKELAEFKNTDVEVPAKLTVDGQTLKDVGVRFRGMSSFGMVGEGQKRSFNISLDFADKKQQLGGYRTLNLLNSHEDPSFLRAVLFCDVARNYLPAPKANFARVVVNGESWGVYVNIEQFNKEFIKEWYGTTKGARWKVPGSPGGRGSLAYLGDNVADYKKIYEIKTKDDPKAWSDFIRLCKVLNETPPEKLEKALEPILDIDGALRFIALDNTLINNDGYWIRTSDYVIYQDEKGRFHILPEDVNETFSMPGGPGGPGGPGFGPGMFLGRQILSQADKNSDGKLTKNEFTGLAAIWFAKLAPEKDAKITQEQFTEKMPEILPRPQGGPGGFGPPGGGPGGGFRPNIFGGLFTALDANKDSSLTQSELSQVFGQWFAEWDSDKSGVLTEEKLREGLNTVLPRPNFGGPGGSRGPRGGGFNRGPRINGVELDPLYSANDETKPLISKLLAVPSLRTRYLAYVQDISDKWLDWNKLGPIAEKYHNLIAADVKADTRKLDSTEDFEKSLTENVGGGGFGRQTIGLKNFADQRRAYLEKKLQAKAEPKP